ncbi:class I SAM-dependent methyltransferase [Glycomyces sp. NPDC047010]|uniref:class I SAM-dependent methyltransferase n=1 Tax=Glycomyces sp. NPDC047010 TaxID=3155023 RepID=UPI0033D0FCC7
MTAHRSQEAVRRFYTEALTAGIDTAEDLHAPVSAEVHALIASARANGAVLALDVGYGSGKHTIAMLQAGLCVHAVDQVPPGPLAAAVARHPLDPARLHIRQGRLEDFTPTDAYDLVIAKDVLHYLGRDHVTRLLAALIDAALPATVHHLEMFTDIWRITGPDTPVCIEGEAAFTTADLAILLHGLYAGWEVTRTDRPHQERDTTSGRPYFKATRVTVQARKPAVVRPLHQGGTRA